MDDQIQGTFEPRDYCVQYRETDFAFASRLMEEEGIYYFFKHTAGGHQMVLANTPQAHPAMPDLHNGDRGEGGATRLPKKTGCSSWSKGQEIRSGKFTLWDHNFEMPDKHLEADKPIHGHRGRRAR